MNNFYIIVLLVVVIILVFLYKKYWKHNIYGGKFKEYFKDEDGFTLAELLVVVGIIAILVAISIPVFTSQLEKAREATDLANIRSIYAEMRVRQIEDGGDKSYWKEITLSQKEQGWQSVDSDETKIGDMTLSEIFKWNFIDKDDPVFAYLFGEGDYSLPNFKPGEFSVDNMFPEEEWVEMK